MSVRRRWREVALPLAVIVALSGSALLGLRTASRARVLEERMLRDFATLAAWNYSYRTISMLANAAPAVIGAAGARGTRSPESDLVAVAAVLDSLRICCPVAFPSRGVGSGAWGDPTSVRWRASAPLDGPDSEQRLGSLRRVAAWGSTGGALVRFHVASPPEMPSLFVVFPQYDDARRSAGFLAVELDLKAAADSTFGALFTQPPTFFPTTMAGSRTNAALGMITITDAAGRDVFRGAPTGTSYAATVPLGRRGDLSVTFSLSETAVRGLLRGSLPGRDAVMQLVLAILAILLALVIAVTLRRAQHLATLRSEFAAAVTHELRTPLTQILLNAETLDLGRARSSEERSVFTAAIVRETRRLVRLVENVLHFSRAERRQLRLVVRAERLDQLVVAAVSERGAMTEPGTATIRVDAPSPVWAAVDRDAFLLALGNLLDNAARHGGPGVVRVSASTTVGGAEVIVDDEGPGITPADRRRVLDPFVRLDRAHESHPTGSGIGLSVVAEMALAMHGTVSLEEAPGGGLRARLTLQRADAPTEGR